METMSEQKKRLRAHFRAVRMALEPAQHAAGSAAVRERLLATEAFSPGSDALVFVSALDNELDTRGLIRALLARGTRVYVPKVECRVMGWVPIASMEELRPGHFGVPEPEALPEGDPPPAAPVVVPGLAFTPAGYRLGYGGGYFDRFLAGHRGPTFGVAFECQVTGELPVEPHDVPVGHLVTEERARVCPCGQGGAQGGKE